MTNTVVETQVAMSAFTAMSMISISELRWHLLKRARYRIRQAFRTKRTKIARRPHFGGWEMR